MTSGPIIYEITPSRAPSRLSSIVKKLTIFSPNENLVYFRSELSEFKTNSGFQNFGKVEEIIVEVIVKEKRES